MTIFDEITMYPDFHIVKAGAKAHKKRERTTGKEFELDRQIGSYRRKDYELDLLEDSWPDFIMIKEGIERRRREEKKGIAYNLERKFY